MKAGCVVAFALQLPTLAMAQTPTDAPEAAETQEAPPPPPQLASVSLSAPVIPAAPPKQLEIDVPAIQAKFPNLKPIRYFSTVDVVIIGSKAKLGATEKDLNDFAEYCFGQLFKGYEKKALPTGPQLQGMGEYGTLNITIQTFPIGMSCELRMGSVGSENTWVTSDFKASMTNPVKDTKVLKTTIATMIAKAAYTLRKTQGL